MCDEKKLLVSLSLPDAWLLHACIRSGATTRRKAVPQYRCVYARRLIFHCKTRTRLSPFSGIGRIGYMCALRFSYTFSPKFNQFRVGYQDVVQVPRRLDSILLIVTQDIKGVSN